jgi:hypothetical protein
MVLRIEDRGFLSLNHGYSLAQVIDPRVSFAEYGFAEARVLAEVSLLPDRVRVGAGRRPVALAAGEVKRAYRSQELKKQVIVVVTAGWNIMCFDHNLKKLWEDDVQVCTYLTLCAFNKRLAFLL